MATFPESPNTSVAVTANNFVRAETDMYFSKTVREGGFGRLAHNRQLTSIDNQKVVRMNRDTLYSSGVFDLEAGRLTVTLPEAGNRFVSMQVISEDHYTVEVTYSPGAHRYDRDTVGTRYAFVIVRMLVDPRDGGDIEAVHRLQDAITVAQAHKGSFEIPDWDRVSQERVRKALTMLGELGGCPDKFGAKRDVNPIDHLIGTAVGWGGNPKYAAEYLSVHPKQNDGMTTHVLTVRDVPVDGFWSISVYNEDGYFQKNALDVYSINSLTAKPSADGAYRIQFGACGEQVANCLPISKGWNYTVRLYRPRPEIQEGRWQFPEAQPTQ